MTRARNRIELLLSPILLVSSVLLGDSTLAFGQVCLLEVLQLAKIGKEPRDEVNVGGERILHLNGQFALRVFSHELCDRRTAQEVEGGPLEHLRAVHKIDQIFETRLQQFEQLFANVGAHIL